MKILLFLGALIASTACAFAANPSFSSFIGTNGITITTSGTGGNQVLFIGASAGPPPPPPAETLLFGLGTPNVLAMWNETNSLTDAVNWFATNGTLLGPTDLRGPFVLSKETLPLALGTNLVNVIGSATHKRLFSITNNASLVTLMLSGGTNTGHRIVLENAATNKGFTLPHYSTNTDGGHVYLQQAQNWAPSNNFEIIELIYEFPDWIEMGRSSSSNGFGGVTINPTLNYIPYKNGAASFGDSPWYFISSEKMGFNGTVQTVFLDTLGNVAFGRYTMPGAVTGSNNTSFGQSALGYLTSGNRNTAYGFGAASNLLSGNDVTAWGWNAQPQAAIDTNEVVVGSGALGNGPNTATIGDLNMRTIYFQNSASNNVEIKLTNAAGSLRVYIDTNNVGHFTARNIDVDATLGNLRLLTGSSQWNFSDNIVTPGTSNTYSLGTLLFPFKDLYVGTNSIYLGTNVLSAVPASLVYNGYPIQPTSTKAAFITNYTASTSENVLFCTGTNQVITLPSAASVPTGWMFTIIAATTTGSVIVTNSTGAQTILGGLSQTVTSTNRLTIVSNGSHYW